MVNDINNLVEDNIVNDINMVNDINNLVEDNIVNDISNLVEDNNNITSEEKLSKIHTKLKINYGNFSEEYPEQIMSIKYIKPNNYVLEIGGNIGRNSCIIASLLKNSKQLLVFESDPDNFNKLKENRDLNNLEFNIEDCAISKIELFQKEWITKSKDLISDNEITLWKPIKTITWLQIKNKYKIIFDTLVADCEGALYYILKEEPNFLENFKTIIIENDFNDINHKNFVDEEFKRFNFNNVYIKSGGFGSCYNNFYEVWTK
jgi:FkbM family methyltransferase